VNYKSLPKLLSVIRIVVGLLFLEHGLATAFGLFEGRPDHNFAKLHAWAGPIETTGAIFLILGLFTRTTGFILAGEMAIAYFQSRLRWAGPPGWVLLALPNNGEEAALNSFFFLWLMSTGGGAWSLDALIAKMKNAGSALKPGSLKERVSSWEPQLRGILRIVAAYMIFSHGLREVFHIMLPRTTRGADSMMPLDSLGQAGGVVLLVLGLLLLVGWQIRPVGLLLALQCVLAYFVGSVPRDPIPIRNGGIDDLVYACIFVYMAFTGAGAWSLESTAEKKQPAMSVSTT